MSHYGISSGNGSLAKWIWAAGLLTAVTMPDPKAPDPPKGITSVVGARPAVDPAPTKSSSCQSATVHTEEMHVPGPWM